MRTMPLEEYVLGVVAAEGSTEGEVEALKSLAVASRTYALKNLQRHASDGYDFCTNTHCQRYRLTDADASGSQVSAAISQAVHETSGQILRDNDGRIVDSYFSASCGGATANISKLWGVKAPSYLTGSSDEYCRTMPHHTWRDVISSTDLLRALESDPRTNVGGSLTNVEVTRRDASGRAELVTIEGARRRTVKGWDFKIIVGRALGWNLLKSSRFDISRSRSDYIFWGSGFGHGLGLCQEGAHVMARRGAGYQQILAKYFPGTRVETQGQRDGGMWRRGDAEMGKRGDAETGRRVACKKERSNDGGRQSSLELTGIRSLSGSLSLEYLAGQEGRFTPADSHGQSSGGKPPFLTCEFKQPERSREAPCLPKTGSFRHSVTSHHAVSLSRRLPVSVSPTLRAARRMLSSEHFRLSYPQHLDQRKAEYVLKLLESNRIDLVRRGSTSGVRIQLPTVEVFINGTTGDFVGRTGQPSWVAAATIRERIELQPFELLTSRRILETTIRHELVHSLIEALGHGRAPRWLAEGLALHLAGEGPRVIQYSRNTDTTLADLELKLSRPAPAEDMRADYAAAYREVKKLIEAEGESAVWWRVVGHRFNQVPAP